MSDATKNEANEFQKATNLFEKGKSEYDKQNFAEVMIILKKFLLINSKI